MWNKQRKDEVLLDVDDVALGNVTKLRWNEPGIHALVGGFHLTGREPSLPKVIEELRQLNPDVLAPAHCVSHQAATHLTMAFPGAFVSNAVGTIYVFGP